jgi:phosphatidylglycerophosphatase A
MLFKHHAVMIMATGCYIGRSPVAPGTLGSLIGLPIAWGLSALSWPLASLISLALIAVAVWITDAAERIVGAEDPGCIVLDEIAGMVVALNGIPFSAATALGGFVLFRIFDITKPPPVGTLDRRLHGGWGIVMDDIAAGVMANVALRIGIYVLNLL